LPANSRQIVEKVIKVSFKKLLTSGYFPVTLIAKRTSSSVFGGLYPMKAPKRAALIAIVSAGLLVLSGCSSSGGESSGPITLNVWGFSSLYKPQVEQYEIRARCLERGDRIRARVRARHGVIPVTLEERRERVGDGTLVIDDENGRHQRAA